MSDRAHPVRLRFRHLSGPREGEVDDVALPAVLGSDAGAHVRVPGSSPRHALVLEREGEIVLEAADSGAETRIEGEPVRDAVLRDGDVLQLGADGPLLRLEPGSAPSEELLTAAPWKRARGRLASLRALAASAYARVSPPVRWLLVIGLLLTAFAAGLSHDRARRLRIEVERLQESLRQAERDREQFATRVAEERARAEADGAALASQVEELRGQEQALYTRLADAASAAWSSARRVLASALAASASRA